MAIKSVYLPNPKIQNNTVEIGDEEHRHLVVARVEVGESLEVFNGKGTVWACSVKNVGKRVTTAIIENERIAPAPAIELILAQALIRTSAMELAIEKAVEIGVTRIMPFIAARSNVTTGRVDRWERIMIEAAKQSKHFHLPMIESPVKFDRILSTAAKSRILLAERKAKPLKSCVQGSPALYVVGPEGGWTDGELKAAELAGFCAASLGEGILRAETAAIVGGALIHHELQQQRAKGI
jgi:16S rRNA (uracil1498-N3)-methyltransferase